MANGWQVCITDTGSGVAKDELAKLFTPFYRTDEARDRTRGGVGLGLSIARRTVALHGGEIWAEQAAGGGLCVKVTLPAVAPEH